MSCRIALRRLVVSFVWILVGAAHRHSLAQVPVEVSGVKIGPASTLSWSATAGANSYNVYRGTRADLVAGVPPRCHGYRIPTSSFATPLAPAPGELFVYLVTAVSASGEGTPGTGASGPRSLLGTCEAVERLHV